jgi:hypothetical protein
MLIPVAEASGVGRGAGLAVPAAIWIKKKWPDGIELFGSATVVQEVPVAEAYCTEKPFKLMETAVGLYSSTKSFVYWAPELPPPPYTCEINSLVGGEVCPMAGRAIERPARRRAKREKRGPKNFMNSLRKEKCVWNRSSIV